jgi:hypothetical protein
MRLINITFIVILISAGLARAQDSNQLPVAIDFKVDGLPDLRNKAELDKFIATVKSDTMPKIITLNDCVQRTKIITESYRDIKLYGFGKIQAGNDLIIDAKPENPPTYAYDTNLLRNFTSLQKAQTDAMDKIEAFHSAMKLPENFTQVDIQSRLTTIDAKIEALMTSVADSASKEDAFLFLVNRSSELLKAISKDSFEDLKFILSDNCKNVPIAPVAAYISADLASMADGVNEMKTVVNEIRDRRHKMISYLYNYHRYKLTTAYYQGSTDQLTNLQDAILSVFATARLVEEMNGWWQAVNTKGLADRYHTLYCQYDEALRRLRATRGKAEAYLEKVDTIKDAPQAMKDTVKQQANSMLATIDRNINKLLKGGWEAQFNQQKFNVNYMLTNKELYVPQCESLLNDYKTHSETVKSNDDFHTSERKYFALINTCVAKGSK